MIYGVTNRNSGEGGCMRVRKEVEGQIAFFSVSETEQSKKIKREIRNSRRNANARYNRDRRRRNLRCTVCGEKLIDTSYMICHVCRRKAADYMMKTRREKKDI
jgi:hypothetical protein